MPNTENRFSLRLSQDQNEMVKEIMDFEGITSKQKAIERAVGAYLLQKVIIDEMQSRIYNLKNTIKSYEANEKKVTEALITILTPIEARLKAPSAQISSTIDTKR